MTEHPSCYGHATPTARKPHFCASCRGRIEKGEQYHLHHGVWDGIPATLKICSVCEQLRAARDLQAVSDDELTALDGILDCLLDDWPENRDMLVTFVQNALTRGAPVSQRIQDMMKGI